MSALHEEDRFGNILPVSLLSRVTYRWINKTLNHGNRSQLQEKDLLKLREKESSQCLIEVLEMSWKEEEHLGGTDPDRKGLLLRALFKSSSFHLCILLLLMLFDLLMRVLMAVFVGVFIGELSTSIRQAFIYAGLLGFVTLLYGTLRNFYMYRLQNLGIQLRTALTGLIFKKVLKLNQKSLHDVTSAHMTRLISFDCESLQTGSFFVPYLSIFPLEVIIFTALSWQQISWLSLFATGFVVAMVPIQTMLRRLCTKMQYEARRLSSQRTGFMMQIVTGIRTVKMNVWETPLKRLVNDIRRSELKWFKKIMVVFSLQQMLQLSCMAFISLIVFPSLVYLGEDLTAVKVFSTLALYTCLVQSALEYVSRGTESIPQAIAAAQRIENFLKMEDLYSKEDIVLCRVVGNSRFFVNDGFERLENKASYPTNVLSFGKLANQDQSDPTDTCKQSSRVWFQDASFSWSIKRQIPALSGISLELDDNLLLGVTGPSGSGKTALLLATLQELPQFHGHFLRAGRAVYVPQVPWICTGSLRDNILCDSPFAEDRYWKVIYACKLDKDILEFPNGDLTTIGEGGVSLTVDQRTRVSLARAAYCEADIYLFDDCFFSLAKSRKLVKKLIVKSLSQTCRIIVSNSDAILEQCDQVLVMEGGRIKHQGSFSEVKEHINNTRNALPGNKDLHSRDFNTESHDMQISKPGKQVNQSSQLIVTGDLNIVVDDVFPVGASNWSVYWKYFRTSRSIFVLVLLMLLVVTGQGIMVLADWWLARWSNMEQDKQVYKQVGRVFYGVTMVAILLTLLRSLGVFLALLKTSERLHNRMLKAVLKAHISFFDSNSPAKVIHRFSKDTQDLDISLPYATNECVKSVLLVLSVTVVSIAVNYWLSLACVPLLLLCILLRRYALRSTNDLSKLKRKFRGDIVTHFKTTLDGMTCIRAFNIQEGFLVDVYRLLNNTISANTMQNAGMRWMCLRIEVVCSVFILVLCIAAVLVEITPSYAGMSLLYAIQLFLYIQWIVMATAETESLMSSFARVSSYTTVEPEPGYAYQRYPPKDWPKGGGIKCEDLSYESESQETLNSAYFDILPSQKIAIVGQKDSGTTSLVSAIFRMPEPKGRVIIDQVDITELSLKSSRRIIGFVPQHPKRFGTNLRFNLDPYEKFDNDSLLDALEMVQFESQFQRANDRESELSRDITELSNTDIRLVNLAHALLEDKKILIVEEEENGSDWSNKRIQDVIRTHFQDHTVITLAQSMDTIMSSDRLLVMRNGCVTEFERPSERSSQSDDELMDIINQAILS